MFVHFELADAFYLSLMPLFSGEAYKFDSEALDNSNEDRSYQYM